MNYRATMHSVAMSLLFGTAALGQTTDTSTRPDTLRPNQIVVTLGNSITELGESPRGYVSLMRRILNEVSPEKNVIIVNSGISGHKSTDMAARFDRDVVAFQPDWVTISVGINDVWHGFDATHPDGGGPAGVALDEFKARVSEMVEKAQANHIRVTLFTTTVIQEYLQSPENKRLVDYNIALRDIALKYHCLLIDQNKAFHDALAPLQHPGMAMAGALTVDGVHMVPGGDWLMARTALVGFGIPASVIDGSQRRIFEAVDREEEAREDNAAIRNHARTLFFGSPREEDRFQNLGFTDRYFVTDTHPRETVRQSVARFKGSLLQHHLDRAILFLDGCTDIFGNTPDLRSQSAIALSKAIQLAGQYAVKLAVVGPARTNANSELTAWIKDSCEHYGLAYVEVDPVEGPGVERLAQRLSAFAGQPLIGISSGGPFLDDFVMTIAPLFNQGSVRYTTDGTDPVASSLLWKTSFTVNASTTVIARQYFSAEISTGVRKEELEKMEFRAPTVNRPTAPGLHYDYYEGAWDRLPDFDSLKATSGGIVATLDLATVTSRAVNWGAVFTGCIAIPEDGLYTFYIRSDDGSRLFIDDRVVADNDGLHGAVAVSGKAALKAGKHSIKVMFFQREGGEFLGMQWKSGRMTRMDIPAGAYGH